jgi:hypothetical protein
MTCSECKGLMNRHSDAATALTLVNKELYDAALSYEADMYNRIMMKCHAAFESCQEARHRVRAHMLAAHEIRLP